MSPGVSHDVWCHSVCHVGSWGPSVGHVRLAVLEVTQGLETLVRQFASRIFGGTLSQKGGVVRRYVVSVTGQFRSYQLINALSQCVYVCACFVVVVVVVF